MIFLLKAHQLGHQLDNIWKRTVKKRAQTKNSTTYGEIMGRVYVRLA